MVGMLNLYSLILWVKHVTLRTSIKTWRTLRYMVMIGFYINIFRKSSRAKSTTISRLLKLHRLILRSHVKMASLTYRNVRNRYWRSQYKIKQHVSLKYSQRGIILQVVGMLSLYIVTMRNLCYASSLLIGRLTSQMFLQGGIASCMTYLTYVVALNVYSGNEK